MQLWIYKLTRNPPYLGNGYQYFKRESWFGKGIPSRVIWNTSLFSTSYSFRARAWYAQLKSLDMQLWIYKLTHKPPHLGNGYQYFECESWFGKGILFRAIWNTPLCSTSYSFRARARYAQLKSLDMQLWIYKLTHKPPHLGNGYQYFEGESRFVEGILSRVIWSTPLFSTSYSFGARAWYAQPKSLYMQLWIYKLTRNPPYLGNLYQYFERESWFEKGFLSRVIWNIPLFSTSSSFLARAWYAQLKSL